MATATEMEHDALLAMVRQGPDEAAAAAVTAFAGDINACSSKEDTVLFVALARGRPLTVAALAARGDCNPNVVTRRGTLVLCRVAGWCSNRATLVTFLAQFPTLNVDACDPNGYTPLHFAALNNDDTNVRLLLDAGADPTKRTQGGNTPAQLARRFGRTRSAKLLEAAAAWHNSLRRWWLRAVVGVSKI